MRHLPIPTDHAGQPYAAGAVFNTCIVNEAHDFHVRLTGIVPNVVAAETLYDQQAQTTTLHTFQRQPTIVGANGAVTTDELKYLYTYRMVGDEQPGRAIYDRLRAAGGEKCPLCGVNAVKTLDHHLPKSKYPVLSVAPTNLIPSCRDCQSAKKSVFPTTAEEETLHPYFDNVDGDIWLTAVVNQETPATFTFGVTPPAAWGQLLIDRVLNHMESFELYSLFAGNAANELTGIRQGLTDLFNSGGTAAVQAHLQNQAASWRQGGQQAGRLNSWQLAMYQAAANDNWFYSQGFALV